VARWAPCRRSTFIRKVERLGFFAAEPGGRHYHMRHGSYTLIVPNNQEFSVGQLRMLLRQVAEAIGREVALDEWQRL